MIMQLADSAFDSPRRRVLAVAAACHPDRGSEPGLGWAWIKALAERHDLWVIVGEREGNRPAIQRELRKNPMLREHLRIFFVPRPNPPRITRLCPPLYYRYYRQWHALAFAIARRLHDEIRFDVAHQINMIGYREPGYLWRLNLPFVWGPIDGVTNMPLRFWRILGIGGTAYYVVYNLINTWQRRFAPRVQQARARAGALAAASEGTQRLLRQLCNTQSHVIHDTGPVETGSAETKRPRDGEPLRLVWSGLHIPRKGLPILLHALRRLPTDTRVHVDILGGGPRTRAWQRLATRLGIHARLTWRGRLSKAEALDVMRAGHVFVITSLRDATSSVLMEALSLGLPVICLDHCGFTDVVTPACGIKIPLTHTDDVIAGFARVIADLAHKPDVVRDLSEGALERARTFSWRANASAMTELYEQAIAHWAAP
ncbi:MAG: glycosyltransferase, partial [Phycisphaerae bacterium]|nr:glycosyltransferase [Phycisphaerae bacterium]